MYLVPSDVLNIFVRLLLRKAISQWAEHELAGFTDGQYIEGTAPAASSVHIARLQVRYKATRTPLPVDVYENVLHFVNSASGIAGEAVLDSQKAAAEAAFGAFFTVASSRMHPFVALDGYRWYGLTLGDPISGPPTRVTDITDVTAGGPGSVPSQVACAITMRTGLRKHWGRIYVPCSNLSSTNGMFSSATVDALANGFRTFITACQAVSLTPVIFSPQRQSVMSIASIAVDDVPDIIRRRRARANTYQKVLTS